MSITWIAEEEVIFVSADGRRRHGRLGLGLPVKVDPAEARCLTMLDGLDPAPIGISGASTLQALLLGVRFLGFRLQDFLSKGGRVLDSTAETDVELEALFGPMLDRLTSRSTRSSKARKRRRKVSRESQRKP
jgi:hypothetical protein